MELPAAPFQQRLYSRYSKMFMLLYLLLLTSLIIAELISRRVGAPLLNLTQLTHDLPAKLAQGRPMTWPKSAVIEINQLIQNFLQMADQLKSKFAEIRQINETLEDEVIRQTEDLRKSEESLSITLHSIGDAVIATDTQGRVTRMNAAAERLTGWPFSEARLMNLADIFNIIDAQNRKKVENPAALVLTTGKMAELANHTILISRDKTEYQIADSAAPIRDQNGAIRGVILIFSDVTKRYDAEQEKDKLRAQLAQAQKMESVGRLAGGVAHDFNNMLGVILGHAETAMDSVAPESPLQAHLEEIRKAAQRSADLTRHLLAFARKQAIAPKVLNLNDVVESMLKMLRRLIGEDINLLWMPGTNLWTINIDPSQVDQILANICVNAKDAIGGVGKITLETENVTFDEAYCADHIDTRPGNYVLLAVSDNGCGMDKETMSHLFEPFFTTKKQGEGTGLGLATVYGIVTQNQGMITVYSEPGHGTTFRIYLPQHSTSNGTEEQETSTPWAIQPGSESILLVEDEPAMLAMGKMMLEKLGYSVLTASTPGQALRLAGEYSGKIDLLITDVIMPELNGRDLAQKLLALYPRIKCLFMSGYTADIIAHHGVLEEGVSFIQKPFSKQNLSAKVREVLDSKD